MLILHWSVGVGKTMLIQALVEGCSRYNPKRTAFRFAVYLDNIDKSLTKLFHQVTDTAFFVQQTNRKQRLTN